MSQCSQPWVCEIIDTELPVPPTGKAALGQRADQGRDLVLVGDHELDIAADREAHMAVGVGVGDVAELADRPDVHLPLGAGAHGPDLIAAVRHMVQHAGPRPVVVLPVAVVLQHRRMHELLVVRGAAFDGGARGHVCFSLRRLLLAGVDLGDLVVPAVGAHIGVGARRGDHVRVDVDFNALEEVDESDALDHLAGALVLKRVLGEEVDRALAQVDQGVEVGIGLERHEGHDHGAHQVADLQACACRRSGSWRRCRCPWPAHRSSR
jgi:hypothetical protein